MALLFLLLHGMESVAHQIPDSNILSLIREKNLRGRELLYDKYAPVMYGIIRTHTADKSMADEILIDLFIRLKNEAVVQKIYFTLCVCILRYTYNNIRKELKKRRINYTISPNVGKLQPACSFWFRVYPGICNTGRCLKRSKIITNNRNTQQE